MASAPIGALRAEISANSAAFAKDMAAVRRSVKSETGRMRASFKKLRSSTASLSGSLLNIRSATLAAAGTGGLGLLVKRAVEGADSIAKVGRSIGITGEELQELRFAAERSGVAQAQLDKSMEAFTRRLGQAQQGTGSALRALDQLGLSMKDLEGKTPTEALSMVADRLKGIEDPMQRNAVLADLFSRQGIIMGNMLRLGSAEMENLRGRARELGLVLDEDLLTGAEKAADQLADIEKVIGVGMHRAMLSFMPLIKAFAKIVTNRAFVEALDGFGKGMADGLERAMPHIRAVLSGIASAYETFSSLPAWMQTSGILGAIMFGKIRAILLASVVINEVVKKLTDGVDLLRQAGQIAEQLAKELGIETAGAGTTIDTVPMRAAIEEARKLAEAANTGGNNVREFDKEIGGLLDTMSAGEGLANGLAGAISDFAGSAARDFKSTEQAVEALRERILDLIVEVSVVEPLRGALTGAFNFGLAGLTGGAGKIAPTLPGFARGGAFTLSQHT